MAWSDVLAVEHRVGLAHGGWRVDDVRKVSTGPDDDDIVL